MPRSISCCHHLDSTPRWISACLECQWNLGKIQGSFADSVKLFSKFCFQARWSVTDRRQHFIVRFPDNTGCDLSVNGVDLWRTVVLMDWRTRTWAAICILGRFQMLKFLETIQRLHRVYVSRVCVPCMSTNTPIPFRRRSIFQPPFSILVFRSSEFSACICTSYRILVSVLCPFLQRLSLTCFPVQLRLRLQKKEDRCTMYRGTSRPHKFTL